MKLNNIRCKCEINGKFYSFKSRMESRYAHYLEWLRINDGIQHWQYEPKTFWFNAAGANLKRGTVSYKPDFLVFEAGGATWYEVKGYMDSRSLTKIKRFNKYFPEEKLIVIDSKWFSRNYKKLKGLVPGWE